MTHPDCPHCYSNTRGRSNYKGHIHYHKPREKYKECLMALIRAATDPGKSGATPQAADLPTELAKYPDLAAFLTLTKWPEDDAPRVTGTMSIFMQDGRLTVMLNDRDAERTLFTTIKRGGSILREVETVLGSAESPWKAYKGGKKKP